MPRPPVNNGSVRHLLQHPLLGQEEERELLARAATGDMHARDRLVEGSGRVVAKIAQQYAGMGVDFEDLWQQGIIGVLDARDKWDESHGVRFTTYAWAWIRHHVARYALANAGGIRVPDHAHYKRSALARGEAIAPGWEEELAHTGRVVASLDEPTAAGGTVGDLLPAPDRGAEAFEQAHDVAAMMGQDCLDDRDRHILTRFYDERARTGQIAEGLGLSRGRVEMLRKAALESIRERLADIRAGRPTFAKRERPGSQIPLPILGCCVER
ncbi:MAG: sigma-70 family RNA polymerase sigma factor [Dehalococcoidia bacterium]